METPNNEKLISLKEAAQISGYAPDYVGQLIRQGKLQGKQVYSNVAWMTTEKSIRDYVEHSQNLSKKNGTGIQSSFRTLQAAVRGGNQFAGVFKTLLYISIAISIAFSFVLFYIFSVTLDHYLNQKAIETVQVSS